MRGRWAAHVGLVSVWPGVTSFIDIAIPIAYCLSGITLIVVLFSGSKKCQHTWGSVWPRVTSFIAFAIPIPGLVLLWYYSAITLVLLCEKHIFTKLQHTWVSVWPGVTSLIPFAIACLVFNLVMVLLSLVLISVPFLWHQGFIGCK